MRQGGREGRRAGSWARAGSPVTWAEQGKEGEGAGPAASACWAEPRVRGEKLGPEGERWPLGPKQR